jgi:thermitase
LFVKGISMKHEGRVSFKHRNLLLVGMTGVAVLIILAIFLLISELVALQSGEDVSPPTLFSPPEVALLPSSVPATDAPTISSSADTPDLTETSIAAPTEQPASSVPTTAASLASAATATSAPAVTAVPIPQSTPVVIQVQQETVPSQVVIRFKPGTSQQQRIQYIQSLNGTVTREIDALDTLVVNVPSEVAERPLPESPAVATSEPDYYLTALDAPPAAPYNDPLYGQQWALPVIGAPDAWTNLSADVPEITVAVIDSGICADHPDLAGRILDGWDFLEQDSVPQDEFGHGCAVSGVIAANPNNGVGIIGAAPNAEIMPLRVLDAQGVGSYSDVAAAIVYAVDNGAQIINLSLGGPSPSSTLESAVHYADSHGVMVIAAAGNTGGSVLYPAAYDPVIAVASVDQDLQRSSFSSYGPEIDLLAPGRDILTTRADGSYGLMSGTSFAAPYVSGVAVLEYAQGQTLTVNGSIVFAGSPTNDETTPTLTPTPIDENTSALEGWLNIRYGDPGAELAAGPISQALLVDDDGAIQAELSLTYADAIKFNGQRVRVTGVLQSQDISTVVVDVQTIQRAPDGEAPSASNDMAEATLTGSYPWVVLLCRFSDSTTTTPHPASWYSTLFGSTYPGLNHFWQNISYNNININGTQVVDWVNLPHPESYYQVAAPYGTG